MKSLETRTAQQDDRLALGGDDPRGAMIAVVSGKGGVGKTNVAVNLAVAASRLGARALLVDGDLGLANVDVLLGLTPRATAAEIRSGECEWTDALVEGPGGVHVLPAASARLDLAASRPTELEWLLLPLLDAVHVYDLVLVDVGAGIGPAAVALTSVCERALLVTTPEPTSLTDAYATLKVLCQTAPALAVELVVNAARDDIQARDTHGQLDRMARRFLGRGLALRATLPRDPRLADAVSRQMAVVEAFPTASASRGLVRLAQGILRDHAPTDRARPEAQPGPRAWRRIGS